MRCRDQTARDLTSGATRGAGAWHGASPERVPPVRQCVAVHLPLAPLRHSVTKRRAGRRDDDQLGLDESRNYVAEALGTLVPQALARRSIAVSVATDRRRYRPGEPVEVTAEFRNRLPVPVVVRTPGRRLWGWSVDGQLEASDEPRYASARPNSFAFRPRERKRVVVQWDGRFKRVGERTRWVDADPGEHEIRAFLAFDGGPSDATTVRVE